MKKVAFLILVVVLYLIATASLLLHADEPQYRILPLDSKVILAIDFSPSASEVTETIFTCIQEVNGLFCRPTIQNP